MAPEGLMIQWWVLNRELELWASAGRRLELWWRDDDARIPTPSLDRLLKLARRYETPLTLAVVPDWDRSALAGRLACERQAVVIQHGVDHQNVGDEQGPKSEFPNRYPREVMETRLLEARERLSVMPRFAPVFAPPWNQVHAGLIGALRASGYRGLSAFGEDLSHDRGFSRLDVHLSLLGDCGEGPFRGAEGFVARFARLARERRRTGRWDQPIGLQTHHLDHDEAAWRCLEDFLDRTTRSPAIGWKSINALLSGERVRRVIEAAPPAPRAADRGRVRI
jgi:hypothetical protein